MHYIINFSINILYDIFQSYITLKYLQNQERVIQEEGEDQEEDHHEEEEDYEEEDDSQEEDKRKNEVQYIYSTLSSNVFFRNVNIFQFSQPCLKYLKYLNFFGLKSTCSPSLMIFFIVQNVIILFLR